MHSIFLPHEQKKLPIGFDSIGKAAPAHGLASYPTEILVEKSAHAVNSCWGIEPELSLCGKEIVDPPESIKDVRRISRPAP